MKKIVAMFFVLCSAHFARAQRQVPIVLNVYGGYTFADRINLGNYYNYNNYGYIEDDGQWGGSIEAFVDKQRSVELSYQYMGTHADFYDWQGQTNHKDDAASIQYIMIGGNNYLPTNSNILPYGGIGLGLGIAHFNYYDDGGSSTLTKFAWNLHLGVKIKTQSTVAFKLQAYLQSIVQGVGVGVGFGTGGAGAGVTTYSTMLQFGLGGGISFAIGHRK